MLLHGSQLIANGEVEGFKDSVRIDAHFELLFEISERLDDLRHNAALRQRAGEFFNLLIEGVECFTHTLLQVFDHVLELVHGIAFEGLACRTIGFHPPRSLDNPLLQVAEIVGIRPVHQFIQVRGQDVILVFRTLGLASG